MGGSKISFSKIVYKHGHVIR